jgi:hypothetical protein
MDARGVLVSHPCGRKKPQGWGTGFLRVGGLGSSGYSGHSFGALATKLKLDLRPCRRGDFDGRVRRDWEPFTGRLVGGHRRVSYLFVADVEDGCAFG